MDLCSFKYVSILRIIFNSDQLSITDPGSFSTSRALGPIVIALALLVVERATYPPMGETPKNHLSEQQNQPSGESLCK